MSVFLGLPLRDPQSYPQGHPEEVPERYFVWHQIRLQHPSRLPTMDLYGSQTAEELAGDG